MQTESSVDVDAPPKMKKAPRKVSSDEDVDERPKIKKAQRKVVAGMLRGRVFVARVNG